VEGKIFEFGVEWRGGRKICIFQRKTGHVSEMLRDTAKVTINHQYEMPYTLSDEIKNQQSRMTLKVNSDNQYGQLS